jgi:hypothetical protein
VYFFTLKQADINATSTVNALLLPATALNATFAQALHAALRLPAAYPASSIHAWLEDAKQPAQRRRLQEALPLQDNNQQELQQQQQQQAATVLAVWGFQIWPSGSLPRADAMLHDELLGEDAGMSVVLQLLATGVADPRSMGQLQGSISTNKEDALEARIDSAAGALALHVWLCHACVRIARWMNQQFGVLHAEFTSNG